MAKITLNADLVIDRIQWPKTEPEVERIGLAEPPFGSEKLLFDEEASVDESDDENQWRLELRRDWFRPNWTKPLRPEAERSSMMEYFSNPRLKYVGLVHFFVQNDNPEIEAGKAWLMAKQRLRGRIELDLGRAWFQIAHSGPDGTRYVPMAAGSTWGAYPDGVFQWLFLLAGFDDWVQKTARAQLGR